MEAVSSSKTLVTSYQITNPHSIIPQIPLIYGLKMISKSIQRPLTLQRVTMTNDMSKLSLPPTFQSKQTESEGDWDDDNQSNQLEQSQNHSENI